MPEIRFPQRYRLKQDPYQHGESLHPLLSDVDERLWVSRADIEELRLIEEELADGIKARKPVFCLAQGESGCGTTTTAHYLLYKHFSLRGVKKSRFVVGSARMETFDIGEVLRECVSKLKVQMRDSEIAVSDGVLKEMSSFLDTVGSDPRLQPFNDLMWKLNGQLTLNEAAFSFLIADVKTPDAISKLVNAFRGIPAAVIFTIDDYKQDRAPISVSFRAAVKEVTGKTAVHSVVQLKPVGSAQAREILKSRWQKSRAVDQDELPFDDVAIEQAFPIYRPIKRVVLLMGKAVEAHSAGKESEWPENRELRIPVDRLRELVNLCDEWVPK
jgi:hypothetical protein